jgi:hypothetical protein
MAVAVIAPFAAQRVIEIPARELLIGGEQVWSYPVSVDGVGLRYKVSCR